MDFDGSQFLGVDALGVADNRPADTAITHYLVNNARYIERGFDSVGNSQLLQDADPTATTARTGKFTANVNEMFMKVIPIQFDRIPRRVRVNIWIPYADSGAFELSARVDTDDFSGRDFVIVDNSTPGPQTFELVIDVPDLARPQSGVVSIGYVTKDVSFLTPIEGPLTNAEPRGFTTIFIPTRDDYEDDQNFTNPEWVGRTFSTQDTPQSSFGGDHVRSLGDDTMAITGATAGSLTGSGDLNIAQMTSVQVASYQIDIDYIDDYFDPSELRANVPEFSDVNRRIAAIQNRQFERPVLLSMGPEGRRRVPDGWPNNYRSEWSYADGDDGLVELHRESHQGDKDLTNLDFFGLFCPVHLVRPPLVKRLNIVETLYEQRATATWNFTLTVEQVQPDGGNLLVIDVTSRTQRRGVEHLPNANVLDAPILQQAFYQKSFDDASTDYAQTYNEGSLQPQDLQFLLELSLSVPIEGVEGFDRDLPFDVVLSAERDDTVDPVYRFSPPQGFAGSAKDPVGTYFEPEFLRIMLIDFVLYGRRLIGG